MKLSPTHRTPLAPCDEDARRMHRSDRRTLRRTIRNPSASAKDDGPAYHIIHRIHRPQVFEASADEVRPYAMRGPSGLDHIGRMLIDPRHLGRPAPESGILTHDVHRAK